MQQTTKETMLRINQMHSTCFHLFLNGVRQDWGICSAKYTAAVSQSDAFTLGNACASKLEITLDGVHRDLYGAALKVTWSVADGEEYPLISGVADTVTVSGGRTKAEVYDAMYTGGARAYQPAEICLSSCTGADVLRDIAAGMGVTLEPETAEAAAEIALTEGVGNMGAECSLSAAAGTVAALMGGNAIISRAGALAVVCYSETGWASECYQSGGAADNENWTPGSLTFQRTDQVRSTGEDGTTIETDVKSNFTAGTGDGVAQSNQLATQTLTEGAFQRISSIVIRPGNYTLPGGLLLEPGDMVTLDGYHVPVMGLTLDFDGGIKATVTAAANAAKGGAAGPVSQALNRIEADLARFKELEAENAKIQQATIERLVADNAHLGTLVVGAVDKVDDLEDRIDSGELKGEDATLLYIDSSRGTVFKNSAVSTILSVILYSGSKRITTAEEMKQIYGSGAYIQWSWQRLDEDRFGVISVDDPKIINDGFGLVLTPDDVDVKVTFSCELIL